MQTKAPLPQCLPSPRLALEELTEAVAEQLRLMVERLGKDFEEEKTNAKEAAERKRVEMDARVVEAEKDKALLVPIRPVVSLLRVAVQTVQPRHERLQQDS